MPSQQPVWRLRSQGPAAAESWKNAAVTTMYMESVQRVRLSLSFTQTHTHTCIVAKETVGPTDPVRVNAMILLNN